MNNTIEKQIKLAYEDMLKEKANEVIDEQVEKFRDKLIMESSEIISVILANTLVQQNVNPVNLRTDIHIQLTNVIINKGGNR